MKFFTIIFVFCLVSYSCNNESSGDSKTPNGYSYKMHSNNDGPIAKPGEVVSLHFELMNDKGEVLDNSRNSPTNVPTMQIPEEITGELMRNPMLALIQLMSKGDSASIIVPIDSIPNAPAEFQDNKSINYIVKVIDIEDGDTYKTRMQAEATEKQGAAKIVEEKMTGIAKGALQDYLAGKLKSTDLGDGLKLALIEDTGNVKAKAGDNITVQYYGFFKDGNSFDNSYRAGRPFSFELGKGMVIKGWDLGLLEVPEGSSGIIEIPYALAYGDQGSPPTIPAKTDLYFYVNVEKVQSK